MNDSRMKLGMKEKICYGAGDVSANLIYTTASTYLIYFWTTVYGISAAATAAIWVLREAASSRYLI